MLLCLFWINCTKKCLRCVKALRVVCGIFLSYCSVYLNWIAGIEHGWTGKCMDWQLKKRKHAASNCAPSWLTDTKFICSHGSHGHGLCNNSPGINTALRPSVWQLTDVTQRVIMKTTVGVTRAVMRTWSLTGFPLQHIKSCLLQLMTKTRYCREKNHRFLLWWTAHSCMWHLF